MTTRLPEDLDRRLAAELVPQCPAPARRSTAKVLTVGTAVMPDPRAAEHRAELLAALRHPTTPPSPKETTAA
ncbi:hypothetical protein ACIG0C_30310 [Kitasatospora aureofaciens]|uniref:Uncharacterized protein n=1 Tax=Kitasatospora aureofaciens TaxID=1894 RepID=A0A1E7NEF1_KITAU|nr:hypothetical protein [Kitasatospora aureofaciens]ARF83248.1 hypothetical protein B6264_30375 [Kitasatospora aureofaciens]OEV39018.1 hypothetical protein HS99_0018105 [Kitasatospora aureofaciens]GGU99560.1 hypothetical protein GCM10010502_62560 [Kitasatospora aureofaciens]